MAGVEISGAKETAVAFQRAGTALADIKDAFNDIGKEIASKAKTMAPEGATGKLRNSIKARRRQNEVAVAAGGRAAPYTEFVYFGSVHNSPPNPFLQQALVGAGVEDKIARAVTEAIAEAGL
jgi:hypothetical protein